MSLRLRSYNPASHDRADTYRICLQTGDAGADATPLHSDPDALGNIYVGPYLAFEPDLSLVLEDAQGVCGYCLGAYDTPAFYRRYREEWLPPLQKAHPCPSGPLTSLTPTQALHREYHHPNIYWPQDTRFLSHLHIDLLPRAQGQGWGRQLVEELLTRLRQRNSPGVHLGMWARNDRAYAFYTRMGFQELERVGSREDGSIYLGMLLNPARPHSP